MNGDPNLPPKPTLWQRIKNGISHAIGYIPRGILLTGIVFAGSALLENYTGYGLGVLEAAKTNHLLPKFLTHLAFGSVISGVLGATMAPCPVCPQETSAGNLLTAPFKLSENEKVLGQQIAQSAGDKLTNLAQHAVADAVVPGSGTALQALPFMKNTLGQLR